MTLDSSQTDLLTTSEVPVVTEAKTTPRSKPLRPKITVTASAQEDPIKSEAQQTETPIKKRVDTNFSADPSVFGFMATSSSKRSDFSRPTMGRKPHFTNSYDNRQSNRFADFEEEEVDTSKLIIMPDLMGKTAKELIEIAKEYGVTNLDRVLKHDVLCQIMQHAYIDGFAIQCSGYIEIFNEGHGFLRYSENNYAISADNIYIPQQLSKKHRLRTGDAIECYVRVARKTEKYFTAIKIISINGQMSSEHSVRVHFDNLTPLFPKIKINLDANLGPRQDDVSSRAVDIISPIGKGQRCLIVAPPRTGKTVLMQNVAHAITANHPEISLIVLLIDERPEEVTDMKRSVKGEVVSSTFDEAPERHVAVADFVVEKAKRLVENGKDVVILLDSITRLARAYNTVIPSSGKVLSGGLDANALQRPKRFFGAARNIENGGSLTIIATALVETGSRMDEVIFEEFKGTGNSEIVLDRSIADKRCFPAINISKSGTRKEDEMIDAETLAKRWALRRVITKMAEGGAGSADALEFLIKELKKTNNNEEFFLKMNS